MAYTRQSFPNAPDRRTRLLAFPLHCQAVVVFDLRVTQRSALPQVAPLKKSALLHPVANLQSIQANEVELLLT